MGERTSPCWFKPPFQQMTQPASERSPRGGCPSAHFHSNDPRVVESVAALTSSWKRPKRLNARIYGSRGAARGRVSLASGSLAVASRCTWALSERFRILLLTPCRWSPARELATEPWRLFCHTRQTPTRSVCRDCWPPQRAYYQLIRSALHMRGLTPTSFLNDVAKLVDCSKPQSNAICVIDSFVVSNRRRARCIRRS